MNNRTRSEKLNSFLTRYGFENKMIQGGAVVRLESSKCGIDFDFDPLDNLHFIGIFDPKMSKPEGVIYSVRGFPEKEVKHINTNGDVLRQWETYVDLLERNFKQFLEGDFSRANDSS